MEDRIVLSAPVAYNDGTYNVAHGQFLNVPADGVLANDTGTNLTATADPNPGPSANGGYVAINSDGSFTYYNLNPGFCGADSFTYKAYDGYEYSNSATVSIEVTNTAPVATGGNLSVAHDQTLPSINFNDYVTDADGDLLTFTYYGGPTHGALTPNPDDTYKYQPAPGWTGTDHFTIIGNDGFVDSNPGGLTIYVGNNAPVGVDDAFDMEPDTELTATGVEILGNDQDPDGDQVTASKVQDSGPSHGSLAYFNLDGSFKYTPNAGYTGPDQFQYVISDGAAQSQPVNVAITVQAGPAVNIFNSRGNDFVVSAQDTDDGIPAGEKELRIRTVGDQAATLTITTRSGSGSAYFYSLQGGYPTTMTTPANQLTRIFIMGDQVSSAARNMRVTASIGGVERATWDFTVFTVSLGTFMTGDVNDVLPDSVRNFRDERLNQQTWETGTLGHHQLASSAVGNIVVRGTISPDGIPPTDFNREADRQTAFMIARRTSGRVYKNDTQFVERPTGNPINFVLNEDNSTDSTASDFAKDLTAGIDRPADNPNNENRLYVWTTDTPNLGAWSIPNNGDFVRTRWQFWETVTYAGRVVSRELPWYWVSSQIRQGANINELGGIPGDNTLGEGWINLTMNPNYVSQVPDFTITSFSPDPATLRYGLNNVAFTLDGTGLTAGGAPNAAQVTQGYIYQEAGPAGQRKNFIPLTIISQTATRITGTFSIADDYSTSYLENQWQLVLMIGGKAVTLGNRITINRM